MKSKTNKTSYVKRLIKIKPVFKKFASNNACKSKVLTVFRLF